MRNTGNSFEAMKYFQAMYVRKVFFKCSTLNVGMCILCEIN